MRLQNSTAEFTQRTPGVHNYCYFQGIWMAVPLDARWVAMDITNRVYAFTEKPIEGKVGHIIDFSQTPIEENVPEWYVWYLGTLWWDDVPMKDIPKWQSTLKQIPTLGTNPPNPPNPPITK